MLISLNKKEYADMLDEALKKFREEHPVPPGAVSEIPDTPPKWDGVLTLPFQRLRV